MEEEDGKEEERGKKMKRGDGNKGTKSVGNLGHGT